MNTSACLLALGTVVMASSCKNPNKGQSSANEEPVPDGRVVLVKNGKEVGAFVLFDQTVKPENTSYRWYVRNDGGGTFGAADPAVSTGTEKDCESVRFGSFSVDWSINTDGKGWVYFSKLPTERKAAARFRMCVTDETEIGRIDATDSKWNFREHPSVAWGALAEP